AHGLIGACTAPCYQKRRGKFHVIRARAVPACANPCFEGLPSRPDVWRLRDGKLTFTNPMTFNDDRLRDRLKALADFLPVLEDPDFTCGEMIYPKHKAPNVFYLPFYHLSAEASAFMKMT